MKGDWIAAQGELLEGVEGETPGKRLYEASLQVSRAGKQNEPVVREGQRVH